MDLEPKDNYFSISANELKNSYQERCRKRTHVYNKILEKCYHKINDVNKNDQTCLLYPIPEFILGLPIYNLAYCAAYIIYNLKKNNYVAQFFNPNIVFICWKYDLPEYFEPVKTITYIEPIIEKEKKKNNSYKTITNPNIKLIDFS